MKIYRVGEILSKLEDCIENDIPFSHIRFGDGGLKYMSFVLKGNVEKVFKIAKKEGLPFTRTVDILELWGYYARRADFVDTAQVYFDGYFWPRIRNEERKISEPTQKKLMVWRDLYSRCEIDNENYCNPESNFLMTIRFDKNRRNILDVMKYRRVCIISAIPEIKEVLRSFDYNIDVVKIVGQYENQYKNSFKDVVSQISERATEYDFWLIAGGELGRIYSGLIKEHGGRAIDIGFVVEFWIGHELHSRLSPFLIRNPDNDLETILYDKGKLFKKYI